jgi:hypothetical protein
MAKSQKLVQIGMETKDSIMALKDHSESIFIHNSCFPKQSKSKVFLFKLSTDFLGSFINLVKGASMVKWTTFDPYEDSTIQGSKLFIKFSFFEILFYKMLRNILFREKNLQKVYANF